MVFGGRSTQFSVPHLPQAGSRRGAIGLALAGPGWLVLGLGFGSDGCSSGGTTQSKQLLPDLPRALCRRATLSTDSEHAPVGRQGRVPRLGKWAGGTLGRKSLLQTGGSSSSGVQLETWARGVGRLGRQLGGLAEGCTSLPPFFYPLSRIRPQKLYPQTKESPRPSRQKPSRTLALMENTANKRSSLRVIAPRCQRQGCDETDWLALAKQTSTRRK